jgi:hypothetical protein
MSPQQAGLSVFTDESVFFLPMNKYVLIAEALEEVPYKREHLSWLLRENKVKGRKVSGVWLVDLEDLKDYHAKMEELGTHRHDPRR